MHGEAQSSAGTGLKLADDVHWVAVDDVVFVLDGTRGEYFGLDPATSARWQQIVVPGAARLDVSDPGIQDLVDSAARQGWLVPIGSPARTTPESPPPRRVRLSGVPLALYCLVRTSWSLRRLGFLATYRWARLVGQSQRSSGRSSPDGPSIDESLATFARAERCMLSRRGFEDCLPRSLSLYVFLVQCGLRVRHVIGVRRYPFLAHAWVELDGVALLSRPGAVSDFSILATLQG